ncbi:Lrp/AsnC family transcriptional regulator [Nocardia sp. NEAU-G5]|uniref:Lrp/AsnC family transcriptional regulator n=1 Tax=Nocardia albiluteola TaxID=2842303 RepID=A0ABS6AW69_9NOCA|nr:Lrp/AsnC family transcriptional regulator [Nocardia albiluteola]MBU3062287.1 Lrp/AsnC family transcriptional regulator [Nocardia albiluteola]
MAHEPEAGHDLDVIDRRIIHELVNDGRISVRELAERVHISRAHAYTRLDRLQHEGILGGFTIRIAHERAGLGASAYVGLSIDQGAWKRISARLRTLPFVEHFSLLGGDFDVLVLVRAPNNHILRDLVLDTLHTLEGVRSTKTWLIYEEDNGPGPAWV